jgi:replicative DNA helicase
MTEGRIPPSDLDAESAVLSAIMFKATALDDCETVLRPEHFYADANRRIFEAARACAATGRPTDITAITGALRDAGKLQAVGGTPYLAEIIGTPSVAKVEPYARRIVEKWRLRELIRHCQEIEAEAYADTGDVNAFVQAAEARIYAVAEQSDRPTTLHGARAIMQQCFNETKDARYIGKNTGASTGFLSLDNRIGGLKPGRVYVGAGRPGMGKTSFLAAAAKAVATSKSEARGVYLASIEMPAKQIGDRFIAVETGIDTRAIENGKLSARQWEQYSAAVQTIGGWPMLIEEQGGISVPRLRSSIRRAARALERDHGTKLGLIGVDYLQLMSEDSSGRNSFNENDRLTKISAGLVGIAKEFNVPLILLSQLNRDCEKRPDKRPQLGDLRGSGAIEQDAHTIIFFFREDMYRPAKEQKDRTAEFIIAKCRGGRMGTVRLGYLDYCTKFVDERDDDPDDEYADHANVHAAQGSQPLRDTSYDYLDQQTL